jgi:DNA-binding SARP family transcriptional activator
LQLVNLYGILHQLNKQLLKKEELLQQQGRADQALQTLLQLQQIAPQALPLAAALLARLALQTGRQEEVRQCLIQAQEAQPSIDLVQALAVARQHGDREFLVYEGERRSFNQLMAEADAIAAALG